MGRASCFMMAGLMLGACVAADQPEPRDADPAIAAIQERIAADTSSWENYVSLSSELRHKNRLEEAAQAAEQAFRLAPSPGFEARLEMAKVYATADRSASAINLVKEAEKKKREGAVVDEVKIAEVYAALGDVSAVFRWLDRAQQAGSPNMAGLSTNREFAALRDDPRFKAYAGTP